jgi:hypothetical protein
MPTNDQVWIRGGALPDFGFVSFGPHISGSSPLVCSPFFLQILQNQNSPQ